MRLELDDVAAVMADLVKDATAPLLAEIAALRERQAALEQKHVPPGRDGLPGVPGRDGAIGPKGDPGEKGLDGAQGTPGRDGLDGQDGKQGPPGAPGERGEMGPQGPAGQDGAPGERGEKGDPGDIGQKGDPGERGPIGEKGDPGLRGERGEQGEKGADGVTLGAKDLQGVDYDGERTLTLTFQKGDVLAVYPITLAIPLYRGVYDSTKAYEAGDQVTYSGSMWIAKRATMLRPDEHGDGARDWTLCVKRGRQGNEGKAGKDGKDGINGKDGRNLTPFDPRG